MKKVNNDLGIEGEHTGSVELPESSRDMTAAISGHSSR